MAPQLDHICETEQIPNIEWIYTGTIFNSPDEKHILMECLNMFFEKYSRDGTHNWEDEKYTYQSYYDDDFILQTRKKRKRDNDFSLQITKKKREDNCT